MKIITVSPSDNFTVRAGRVFDGRRLIPGEEVDIVIGGGLIREVLPRPQRPPGPAEGEKALDLREFTVLPGLVDCHVHLALDGKDFNRSLELWSQRDLLEERIRADLARTLSFGIAAVRDGGDREGIGLAARAWVNGGSAAGPRISAAGTALGRRGNYGSFLGPGLPDRESIPGEIEKLARRGVDQVKVLVSGLVSFKNYRQVGPLQFDRDDLAEIVGLAHARGIRVMAHASSDEAVRMALRAGVDSLEHGYFISRESLEDLALAAIPWVPTLAPVAVQARLADSRTPLEREVIEKTFRRQLRMVGEASEAGVPIGVGSDAGAAGVTHGEGFMDELLLLEEAGLSREEILRAATAVGSRILGLDREMGRVAPGFKPCLAAVRGSPPEDLRDLAQTEYIILPSGGE